jgi:hypothetical protein
MARKMNNMCKVCFDKPIEYRSFLAVILVSCPHCTIECNCMYGLLISPLNIAFCGTCVKKLKMKCSFAAKILLMYVQCL